MGTLTQMLCNHQFYRQIPCYRYHPHFITVFWLPTNEKKETKFDLLAPFYPVILTAISTDNKHGSVPVRSSHVRCNILLTA